MISFQWNRDENATREKHNLNYSMARTCIPYCIYEILNELKRNDNKWYSCFAYFSICLMAVKCYFFLYCRTICTKCTVQTFNFFRWLATCTSTFVNDSAIHFYLRTHDKSRRMNETIHCRRNGHPNTHSRTLFFSIPSQFLSNLLLFMLPFQILFIYLLFFFSHFDTFTFIKSILSHLVMIEYVFYFT